MWDITENIKTGQWFFVSEDGRKGTGDSFDDCVVQIDALTTDVSTFKPLEAV